MKIGGEIRFEFSFGQFFLLFFWGHTWKISLEFSYTFIFWRHHLNHFLRNLHFWTHFIRFHYKVVLGFSLCHKVLFFMELYEWASPLFTSVKIFSFSFVAASFFSHSFKAPLILVLNYKKSYSYLFIFTLWQYFFLKKISLEAKLFFSWFRVSPYLFKGF